MMKFLIVRKMRSLKNEFHTVLDHFTDISNMVVHGSVSVVAICKIYINRCASCFIATC